MIDQSNSYGDVQNGCLCGGYIRCEFSGLVARVEVIQEGLEFCLTMCPDGENVFNE